MKQFQINRAYSALNKLANMQMPIRDAYNLYLLSERIKPAYNFELEQEKKLIEKYAGVLNQNTGAIAFQDDESAASFQREMAALNSFDVDIEVNPVVISMDSLVEQKIAPIDIMCLDGFVTFI